MKTLFILLLFVVNTAFAQTLMVSHKSIEFDVFQTKVNEFILAHDYDISKVTSCSSKISNMTLTEAPK